MFKNVDTNCGGCVRYKNLILHFKTRTDDSRAIPRTNFSCFTFNKKIKISQCVGKIMRGLSL